MAVSLAWNSDDAESTPTALYMRQIPGGDTSLMTEPNSEHGDRGSR